MVVVWWWEVEEMARCRAEMLMRATQARATAAARPRNHALGSPNLRLQPRERYPSVRDERQAAQENATHTWRPAAMKGTAKSVPMMPQ